MSARQRGAQSCAPPACSRPPASAEAYLSGGRHSPVPVSATLCGLPAALSVMARVPRSVLPAVGVKVTSTVHEDGAVPGEDAVGARAAPQVLALMAKSRGLAPPIAMLAMVRTAVPVLVRVTRLAALVAGRLTAPKFRLDGLSCATGPSVVASATAEGADPLPAASTATTV